MSEPNLKAFVICDEITNADGGKKDLRGAGLSVIRAVGAYPMKRSFWVYIELVGQQPTGRIQLALMRADSGRRVFFRVMPIEFPDQLHSVLVVVRVFEAVLPAAGVYFVELWYDDEWRMDQRIEVF